MSKPEDLARVLEERIARGDYTLKGFPAERPLAGELGVSRVTLRKALDVLARRRVLARRPNGRLDVDARRGAAAPAKTAFLAPAFASPFVNHIRLALERQGLLAGVPVRSVDFVHHDDPVIAETVSGFENVFVTGLGTDAPARVLERITRASCRLVSIESDLTAWNVPSVVLFPEDASRALFEHLVTLGHERIDCVNTLPLTPGVAARIAYWRSWIGERGLAGTLYDEPVEYFKSPMCWAYERVGALAADGRLTRGAVFFTSEFSAIGAMRAFLDAGIRVGRDVAICSLGGDGYYRYLNPSMTVVEMPAPEPFLRRCLSWIAGGAKRWKGELLVRPKRLTLFAGESTRGSTGARRA